MTTVLCGLGNPGKEYLRTRHNLGFMFLETLVAMHGVHMRASGSLEAIVGETELDGFQLKLLMPQTFMNNSGSAVSRLLQYYKLHPSCLIVVHDDMDIVSGSLRVKFGGRSAGHNGINSIDRCIGKQYWRLRLGIGRPPVGLDAAEYVLSEFSVKEMEVINPLLLDLAQSIKAVLNRSKAACNGP